MADSSSSFGCAASDLLCGETEKNLCFDDLDCVDGKTHQGKNGKDLGFGRGGSEPLVGFPCPSEGEFALMVDRERDHLPKDDYLMRLRSGDLDLSVRREALDWIWKAHTHYGFAEQCFVLSMNYFDRFLSVYELPRGKAWTLQLLAVACLSLAAKMEEIEVPLAVDLQVGEPKYVFEGKTIQKMELLVLSSLKWKMQPHTPCTFIDYFLQKIINDGQIQLIPLIPKAIQVIISTIKGIDFLEFRPSEIAAAVALFVSGETEMMVIDKAMSCFKQVKKGRVVKCLEMIHDLTMISSGSSTMTTNVGATAAAATYVPQSPNGVLEAACLSYKSDDRTVVGSCPNSSPNSPQNNTKRRKLDTTTSPPS